MVLNKAGKTALFSFFILAFLFMLTIVVLRADVVPGGSNVATYGLVYVGTQEIDNIDSYITFNVFGQQMSWYYDEIETYDPLTNVGLPSPSETGTLTWDGASSDATFTYNTTSHVYSYDLLFASDPGQECFTYDLVLPSDWIFYYQQPLDDEFSNYTHCNATECWNGTNVSYAWRPENVVGSYAIYKNNSMGNEYTTGKVGHIYRPLLNDSAGNETWGNISINTTSNTMVVCTPTGYFSSVSYPVTVDPTFGRTDVGLSAYATAGSRINEDPNLQQYLPAGSNITHISAYGRRQSGSPTLELAAYNASGDGEADTRLHAAVSATAPTSNSWLTLEVGYVLESPHYVTLANAISSSSYIFYHDSGSTGDMNYNTGQTTLPATWVDSTDWPPMMSMYANYTKYDNCNSGLCSYLDENIWADIEYYDGTRGPIDNGMQIKWNISEFCDIGVDPNHAYMRVYVSTVSGSPDQDLQLYYIRDQTWDESSSVGTISGQTEYNATVNSTGLPSSISSGQYVDIAITDYVKETCDLGYSNMSFRMEDDDYDVGTFLGVANVNPIFMGQESGLPAVRLEIVSREGDNIQRPNLFINYTEPTGADTTPPTVYGDAPTTGQTFAGTDVNFTCNVTDAGSNITNVTLFVYNSTNHIYYTEINTTSINATTLVQYNFIDVTLTDEDTYKYSCFANETSGNSAFSPNVSFTRGTSDTTEVIMEMNIIGLDPLMFWHNESEYKNISDVEIDFKPYTIECKFYDPEGIEFAAIDNDESFGTFQYGPTTGVLNYSNFSGGTLPTYWEINYTITRDELTGWYDTYEVYDWNCYAENENGANKTYYNGTDNVTITMNITPEVYYVHRIDTESANLVKNVFNTTQDFTNYDPGNHTWNAFFNDTTGTTPATFRTYNDDFGNTYKITWLDMTTKIYWHIDNDLGKNPVAARFIHNDTYTTQRELYGDSIGFHFHTHQWYNWTNWTNGGDPPNLPSGYWNQVPFFNNFTCLGDPVDWNDNVNCSTPQDNIEMVLAQRVIDEQTYPSVYVSGWTWEDTNFSNWLEGAIKYDIGALPQTQNDDTSEPIENIYNWSGVVIGNEYAGYHPNTSNYKEIGDMKRIVHVAGGGEVTVAGWENAMEAALNRGRVVLISYDHNYGANVNVISDRAEANYANWQSMRNGEGYEKVNVTFANALTAMQWLEGCTDTVAPEVQVYQIGEFVYVESNEALFAAPYLALEHTDGTYSRGNMVENGTNKWKFNTTNQNVTVFSAGAQDNCGNTKVQTETFENYTNIIYPTTEVYQSASDGSVVDINFTATISYEFQTTGVGIKNITIGGEICTPLSSAWYRGNDIWSVNCTSPNGLTNYQNLTMFVNFTSYTNELSDTETNAIKYQIVHNGAISQGINFQNLIGKFAQYFRPTAVSFTFSDVLSRFASFKIHLSQLFTMTDLLSRSRSFDVEIQQSFSLLLSLMRFAHFPRYFDDSFTINDFSDRQLNANRVTEQGFTFQSILERIFGAKRAVEDSFTITDQNQRTLGANRQTSDSFTLFDNLARILGIKRSVDDSLTITDQTNRQGGFFRSILDFFTITDLSSASAQKYLLEITDPTTSSPVAVSNGQNITIEFNFTKFGTPIADSVTLNNVSIGVQPCTNIIDLTYASNLWTFNCTVPSDTGEQDLFVNATYTTDAVTRTDTEANAVSYGGVYSRAFFQGFSVTDTINRIFATKRGFTETFSLSSLLSRNYGINRIYQEGLTIDSIIDRMFSMKRVVLDSLTLTDQSERKVESTRSFIEYFTVFNIMNGTHTSNPATNHYGTFSQEISFNTFLERVFNPTRSFMQAIQFTFSVWSYGPESTNPTVTLTSPANGATDTDGTVDFTYTPSDSSTIDNCSLIADGSVYTTDTSISNGVSNTIQVTGITSGHPLYSESLSWSVNCTDEWNNVGSSATWTLDTIATTGGGGGVQIQNPRSVNVLFENQWQRDSNVEIIVQALNEQLELYTPPSIKAIIDIDGVELISTKQTDEGTIIKLYIDEKTELGNYTFEIEVADERTLLIEEEIEVIKSQKQEWLELVDKKLGANFNNLETIGLTIAIAVIIVAIIMFFLFDLGKRKRKSLNS